jgi:hypothetical protein
VALPQGVEGLGMASPSDTSPTPRPPFSPSSYAHNKASMNRAKRLLVTPGSPSLAQWAYGKMWPWTPLSFIHACHALPFYALRVGHPCNGLTAVSGVVCQQGGRSAAVFYPLGHPTPYAYVRHHSPAPPHH